MSSKSVGEEKSQLEEMVHFGRDEVSTSAYGT